jgi:hypothetical protein
MTVPTAAASVLTRASRHICSSPRAQLVDVS